MGNEAGADVVNVDLGWKMRQFDGLPAEHRAVIREAWFDLVLSDADAEKARRIPASKLAEVVAEIERYREREGMIAGTHPAD